MSPSSTLDVGRDVHQESLTVASVAPTPGAEVVSLGTLGTRPCAIDQRIRQLRAQSQHLVFVYDAGPCGDGRSRSRMTPGDGCGGVAPAWMPHKAGDRVTPDRRAAMPLARRLRAGDRTPGDVPAVDAAARRDLSRARDDPRRDLQAAQWRLNACWLRHALRDPGRAHWSPAPLRWLREVVGPTPAPPMVVQASIPTGTAQPARRGRLALDRHAPGHTWRVAPVVEALPALRGVPCTVAVTTVAELGDLTRVEHPRQRRHDLGLTPAADASGGRRQPGSMPTTGPTHARRAVVEGAWA
jgi:transposase